MYCGGSDLDKLVADYVVSEFNKSDGVDLSKDSMAMQRVYDAAEKAKMELSNTMNTEINLPYITAVDGAPKHLVISLSRAKFESLIDKEITKVINLGKEAVNKANITNEDLDGVLLVGGSTRIPKVQEELTKAFGKPLLKNVNPDEAVALGAAVQAAILSGEKDDIILLDCTPLRLGIDTQGGVMATVVDANTTIPCKKSQIFTTAENNQPAVTIVVAQGNRPLTKDNKQIGIFTLDGIPPAMRGVPQIEVTFDIDANGILSVSAKDMGTGKEQSIKIESSSSLTDEDIERMKKEAEEHAEEDKKAMEKAAEMNFADSYAFSVEKTLSEMEEGKVDEDKKKELSDLVEKVREALKTDDLDKVKEAQKNLSDVWTPIVQEMYKDANPTSGNTGFNPFGNTNPFGGTNNPFGESK